MNISDKLVKLIDDNPNAPHEILAKNLGVTMEEYRQIIGAPEFTDKINDYCKLYILGPAMPAIVRTVVQKAMEGDHNHAKMAMEISKMKDKDMELEANVQINVNDIFAQVEQMRSQLKEIGADVIESENQHREEHATQNQKGDEGIQSG